MLNFNGTRCVLADPGSAAGYASRKGRVQTG